MARRYQHKVAITDVEAGNDIESFVKIGTPLPPLTSTKADKNEFVPIWKQEVKDEQGRRRLHGAFTGGFSAGYFNTVGSKEGWNPAEFKSSRADKKRAEEGSESMTQGKFHSQKPEHFMDEEDLAELEQRKELQTNSVFGSTSAKPSLHSVDQYDPLTGKVESSSGSDPFRQLAGSSNAHPAFSDLVQPSSDRAGYKIMQKMGWREGQGVGPRLSYERKLLLASKLGVKLDSDVDLEEDPERKKHLFAPVDRPLIPVLPWSGTSGLGYSKSTFSHQSTQGLDHPNPSINPKSSLKIEGQMIPQGSSFGLGALNDAEDDDHDIYASASDHVTNDPRARRLLSLDQDGISIHEPSGFSRPKDPHQFVHQTKTAFGDNTPLPTGFRLARPQDGPTTKRYPPPHCPDTWQPDPKRIWNQTKSPALLAPSGPHLRHNSRPITAHDRARLIGEEAPPKSVFDFISAKDKARLEDAKQLALASSSSKLSSQEMGAKTMASEALIDIPKLDPAIAQAALRGFMPFSHDPPKQQRYKLYLQSQAGILPNGVQFAPKATAEDSVDVINKELDGFVKSAMMFKPMSAMMASRFTSAASSAAGGEMAAPEPGLRQPVFLEEKSEHPPAKDEDKDPPTLPEEVSQAAQAVRMDLFGMMTRSTKTFYPQKLLCKRFNVPNPFPQGPPTESKSTSSSNKLSDFLTANGFQPAVPAMSTVDSADEKLEENPWLKKENINDTVRPLSQVGLGGDESQGRDILTTNRPPIDLFKAIFANDEDSDIEGDESPSHAEDVHRDRPVLPPHSTAGVTGGQTSTKPDLHADGSLDDTSSQVVSLTPVIVDPKAAENLAAFRPTFMRKSQASDDNTLTKAAETLPSKKAKKHKKRPALISFEDDNEDELVTNQSKAKKKKQKPVQSESTTDNKDLKSLKSSTLHEGNKRNREDKNSSKQRKDEDEEDEWVEKVVTTGQSNISLAIDPSTAPNESLSTTVNRKVKRMKATDLMD